MKRRDFVFVTLALPTMAVLGGIAGGCGGGAGDSSTRRGRGQFRLTFLWPKRDSRLIPRASGSIKVILTAADGTALDTRLIVGSDGPPQSSTETFVDLAPGTVTLTATAFPLLDGTGVAQATGAVSAVIQANQTTTVTLTMGSTIDLIDITPAAPTVAVGAQVILTATPRDSQGNAVLTFGSNFTWTAANAAVAALPSNGGQSVAVQGVAGGSAGFTVTESESGKTGTTTVTVGTVGTPGTDSCVPGPVTGPGGLADTPWPTFGHDNARTNRGGPGGATGVLKWSATPSTLYSGLAGSQLVIAADGTLYVGYRSGRSVYALNPETGANLRELMQLGQDPTLGRNGLIYGSNDSGIFAADLETGVPRWSVPGVRGVILGADGTVYTTGATGVGLLALNGTTGAQKYAVSGVPRPAAIGADGTLYVVGTNVDVGLTALEGNCGTTKWKFEPDAGYSVTTGPSIGADGTLYVVASSTNTSSQDARLYAVSPEGTGRWHVTIDRSNDPPSIGADGTLYMVSQRGKLTVHDPATGAQKYAFSAPGQSPSAFGNAAIASDNTLYFSSRTVDSGVVISRLFALNGATGALNWTFVLPGAFTSPQFVTPVIGPDGTVYLLDDDNDQVIAVK